MKTEIKKLPKSQLEITFELTTEEFQKHFDEAISRLQNQIKIDGFRPGQVPQKIFEEKVGKENILLEAGDLAIQESYYKCLSENNLEPIGKPEIQILKIAYGNPFLFKIRVAILPQIDLPNYKQIASQIKKKLISVTEEEINDTLFYLRNSRAKFFPLDRAAEKKDFITIEYKSPDINMGKKIKDEFILGEGGFIRGFEDNLIGLKAGEEKSFSLKFPSSFAKFNEKNKEEIENEKISLGPERDKNFLRKNLAGKEVSFTVKMISIQKVELPEINDDFAKSLGKFDNLTSLKNSIKDGIMLEKEAQEKYRRREEVLERISEETKFELPQILIDSEKERLFASFSERINNDFKISLQDYLLSTNQDEARFRESFNKEAEKRVRAFLILREIGKRENILVGEEEVENGANEIIKNYSPETAKKIDINSLKEYTKELIYNEKVLQFLEKLS